MTRLRHYDNEGTARFVTFGNPVKRDLVTEPGEWVWSNYDCYCGAEDERLRVDRIEI